MVIHEVFAESIVEATGGISAITNCVCIERHFESGGTQRLNKRITLNEPMRKILTSIRDLAVEISWKVSFYGPSVISLLKSNDSFIEVLLQLPRAPSNKATKSAEGIIWRLGNEETIRQEQTKKKRKDDEIDSGNEGHDIFTNDTNRWDNIDVLLSYSNHVQDKIAAIKICERLGKINIRVYNEKQGQQRLESMQKAIDKGIPLIVCLSSNFQASKFCMAELQYASKKSASIIAFKVQNNYSAKGWLLHLIGDLTVFDFTEKTVLPTNIEAYIKQSRPLIDSH